MMMKRALLVSTLLAFAGLAACSDDDDGGGGPGGAGGAGATGGAAGAGGSAGTSGAAGSSGGVGGSTAGAAGADAGFGGDEQCANAPTKQACINCCGNTHPEGAPALLEVTAACICQPAHCATQCAQSLCANPVVQPTPGDACDTCFQQNLDPGNAQGCATEIVTNCQANPDCWAPYKCVEDRGCEAKPDGDGGS